MRLTKCVLSASNLLSSAVSSARTPPKALFKTRSSQHYYGIATLRATQYRTMKNSTGHGRRARIVWIDLEMSGLDPVSHKIVEAACVVTDSDLNVVAQGPAIVIHYPPEELRNMSAWCQEAFGKSGLLDEIQSSTTRIEEADQLLYEFVAQHCEKATAPVAGNSVGMDRQFITQHMPKLAQYLHYRTIDVSTVKELAKRWYPSQFSKAPKKVLQHRALSDILESIDELRYYRREVFKHPSKLKAANDECDV